MAEKRWIPNKRIILRCSRINWWVIARTDFHIPYSSIFVFSPNLEVPRIYSAHYDEYREYTNTLIHTLLVRLFSSNVLGYSPRIYGCAVPPLYYYVLLHYKLGVIIIIWLQFIIIRATQNMLVFEPKFSIFYFDVFWKYFIWISLKYSKIFVYNMGSFYSSWPVLLQNHNAFDEYLWICMHLLFELNWFYF